MEGKVDDLHILDQRPALDHELTWKVSVLMMVMRVLLGGHDGYIIALIEDTCTTPWSANKSHYIWYLQKYPILAVICMVDFQVAKMYLKQNLFQCF